MNCITVKQKKIYDADFLARQLFGNLQENSLGKQNCCHAVEKLKLCGKKISHNLIFEKMSH